MTFRFGMVPLLATALASSALAQYTAEPIATPPTGAPANYLGTLSKEGYRVSGPNGVWCEVWFLTALPKGAKSAEDAVAFPSIPAGALLGVLRFPDKGADRRGQPVKAGVYTLRYALYPVNGDHQGVAPQRDFAVLSPIADDPDPAAIPTFEALMTMSRKASGTPHPAVLSLEMPPGDAKPPSLSKEGEKDWSLAIKVGDTPLAIIVVGKSEA